MVVALRLASAQWTFYLQIAIASLFSNKAGIIWGTPFFAALVMIVGLRSLSSTLSVAGKLLTEVKSS